jgi:arylsulfatase A-like enzyme
MDAFAQRATVYHNHYSDSNFTTTGVASMLTGMHGWKHRAINFGGLIRSDYVNVNPYSLLGKEYYRLLFSQNTWPDRLVGQVYGEVDRYLSPTSYSMVTPGAVVREFDNDPALASIAKDFMLSYTNKSEPAGSSLLGYLYKRAYLNAIDGLDNARYPKGMPGNDYMIPYLNEHVFNGLYSEISNLAEAHLPFFAYFHLISPHAPYRPRRDYNGLFRDKYKPPTKPVHPLAPDRLREDFMMSQRTMYDRLIAQLDDEFGKLVSRLEADGILDDCYLILTSDHGELFERGYTGHGNPLMYESVIRIPLLIRAPHQETGQAVFSLTSNIDLLPTLLSVAGKSIPAGVDGKVLPGFGGVADEDRPIFSIFANKNPAFAPLKRAVFSMRKHNYKLIAYLGYPGFDHVYELYDLESDPEELTDLSALEPAKLKSLRDELFTNLEEANRLFEMG